MSFIEKKKRHLGDRRDGVWVKDAPGLNVIMAGLYPNRCDCEVCMEKELDITNLLKYVEEKNNSGQEFRTKVFHCFVTMVVRILNERRVLNRFVRNCRVYERDEITVSFVAKRQFSDKAEEALLVYKARPNHSVDDVSRFILGEVKEVRKELPKGKKKKELTDTINKVAKFPKWLVRLITGFVRLLDRNGKVPKSFQHGDPAFTSILISNLGSIGCPSVYHHLNNYGTNSIMITIGKIHKVNEVQDDGSIKSRDIMDIHVTADERICDGFYFAKSLRILDYLCEHPELLEKPFEEDIDFEEIFRK